MVAAALLLSGCGGYFSGEWPNLAEGFADAAERDAALEDAAADPDGLPVEAPQPVAEPVVPAPAPVPLPAEQAPEQEPTIFPETVEEFAARLDAATEVIAGERKAYEVARVTFLEGSQEEEAARGRWLTAQLKLSGLSRAGSPLETLQAELPLTDVCPQDDNAEDDNEACRLARRIEKTAVDLDAYLAEERAFLISMDPAGSN